MAKINKIVKFELRTNISLTDKKTNDFEGFKILSKSIEH